MTFYKKVEAKAKAKAKAKEIFQDKHVMGNMISFKTLVLALWNCFAPTKVLGYFQNKF